MRMPHCPIQTIAHEEDVAKTSISANICLEDQLILIPEIRKCEPTYDHIGDCQ